LKSLGIQDKLLSALFSNISLALILPIIFGVLIIFFPTILADWLATIHISLPEFFWGGVEIPLQHILTTGVAQGMMTCAIPILLGLAWNRWAGGASGFLLSLLYVLASAAQYGEWFYPTVDWLGLVIAGMLAGYIAGALMSRSRMQGSDSLKSMLIAAIVAAIVAIIFTTATFVWYSPMFSPINGSVIDGITYNYFINTVIYAVWAILAAVVAKVSTWFS